ncbi:ABC transporter ATP-binding protein [Agathobaculum sp.]|uniref:ABC transporter ATP-binding protein n=1 Tax=Agathobaculum sp. TaxID=2048138 RepID=UPI002A816E1A|nr:ABC transporter ATP-binding protein [Agathobaculum sp.]MDY3619220.1 ABC transporter ATP-binding protein [Agathobaculum sp.]
MMLEVSGLTAGYASPIVREISFSVKEGELLGILGRNGCGKTTLLRGITGAARVFSGSVRVCGQDCGAMRVRERARHIAMLTQRTGLLPGLRAGEVIGMGGYAAGGAFGAPDKDLKCRVMEAAARFGVEALLDTDCAFLSEGQRQLVHLARLAVQDAPVWLLDEPSSALDFYNTHLLFQTVRDSLTQGGHAAVAVLHDPAAALRWCDRLLLLGGGYAVGALDARATDEDRAQAALSQVYPGICVKKDKESGRFACWLDTNVENPRFR